MSDIFEIKFNENLNEEEKAIILSDYRFNSMENQHIINMYSPYPSLISLMHEIAHFIQQTNDFKTCKSRKYHIIYKETFNFVKNSHYFRNKNEEFCEKDKDYDYWKCEMEATSFSYDVVLNTLLCLREILLSKYSLKHWVFKIKDILFSKNVNVLGGILFSSAVHIAQEYDLDLTEKTKDGIAYFIGEYLDNETLVNFGINNIFSPRLIYDIDKLKELNDELFEKNIDQIMDNYFWRDENVPV